MRMRFGGTSAVSIPPLPSWQARGRIGLAEPTVGARLLVKARRCAYYLTSGWDYDTTHGPPGRYAIKKGFDDVHFTVRLMDWQNQVKLQPSRTD
jgi:hypothetical protein